MTERLGSLNVVCEGVVGVKNHTKKCCWPYANFASKMSLLFWFDQMVQKKTRSAYGRKGSSLDFFVFSCFRYPRYQRKIGHMPNVLNIFCLQLRPYGPVNYLRMFLYNFFFKYPISHTHISCKVLVHNPPDNHNTPIRIQIN